MDGVLKSFMRIFMMMVDKTKWVARNCGKTNNDGCMYLVKEQYFNFMRI